MSRTEQEQANLSLVLEMFENVLVPLDSAHVDKYIAPGYIQHSQLADTGPQALKDFLDFIVKENPHASHSLKRSFVDGDHVILHYHVVRFPGDPGFAVVDIFRIENGMIAEHWDVLQDIPAGDYPNPNGPF